MKTAIIGVGNKLMGDEGVGVHAVEYLRTCHPREGGDPVNSRDSRLRGNDILPNVDILDAGTGGMALFHLLERYERVIIIDAADFGGEPGEVHTFDMQKINLTPDSTQVSLHGTSLAGILRLAEKLGTKMPEITVIAVQPEYIGCKMELSPAVKKSLDNIRKAIELWGQAQTQYSSLTPMVNRPGA